MKLNRRIVQSTTAAAFAAAALTAGATASAADSNIANEEPQYTGVTSIGQTWTAKPITASSIPRNPWMAVNQDSNIHGDSWMSDTYKRSGPLGNNLTQTTNNLGFTGILNFPGLCASITFDSKGRIVTVCPSSSGIPTLRMIDPNTLNVISERALPPREGDPPANIFNDFTGGGYFYLDNEDHAVVSTNDRKLTVFGYDAGSNSWQVISRYDLTSVLDSGERLSSALPDWSGNYWFVSKTNGKVGWINRQTGAVHSITLGEEIENSFMVASDGVYIVSNKRLYKYKASGGTVKQVWRSDKYYNDGRIKSGQVDAGSGTTPTMLPGNLVAITDNADPLNIVVYSSSTGKVTCRVPIFDKGSSSDENSLIGWGTASKATLIAENNYGYGTPFSFKNGSTTTPGVVRVDLSNKGRTCKKTWTNSALSIPTLVSKVSLGNGLLYAYTKPDRSSTDQSDAWFWTAVDVKTGNVAWSKFAGTGSLNFNNNYAGLAIGPNGSLYAGLIGGLAKLSDG